MLTCYRLDKANPGKWGAGACRRQKGKRGMPLTFANAGEENQIRRVGGNPQIRAHLEDLGFVPGGSVTVVASMGGNLIVQVKGTRVAISREMASKIMV